jgi:peptidoglycan hydrolase-like protein with peptidoglycan-binding domain
VQNSLNAKGYALVVDGVFGAATAAAVTAFQQKNGLTADGIVGPGTRAALGL